MDTKVWLRDLKTSKISFLDLIFFVFSSKIKESNSFYQKMPKKYITSYPEMQAKLQLELYLTHVIDLCVSSGFN